MLHHLDIIRFLYPTISEEKYKTYLEEMITRNYTQIAVYDGDTCVGLSGLWFGIKLWSGKYLEIDNFIVHPDYRNKGIGKMLTDFIDQKAIELHCNLIVLDAFTTNFTAQKFYINQGFNPKGFHFIKTVNEKGLS